jgi:hypothetical protein
MAPRSPGSTLAALATFAALLLCAGAARALDIPMDPKLAEVALDSKTCFATLTSKGRLVGYELGERLLASSAGRLVTLATVNRAEVGDGRTRSYAGAGMRVAVAPRRTRRWLPEPEVEQIREEALMTIAARGGRRTLPVAVRFSCSP